MKDDLFGPITRKQRARIAECDREIERRRNAAGFVPILENRRPDPPEVNCASCNHLSDFNDEHRRGFCMHLRLMRSTWHPVQCAAFVELARERTIKVAWKGVVYG